MNRREPISIETGERPSVYCMSDRQLAEEYGRLTGAMVQVPSSHNPAAWWQWRSNLQERLKKARLSSRRRQLAF